jgi:uncharacterized protein YprB with RNaseH-like and TPR domain
MVIAFDIETSCFNALKHQIIVIGIKVRGKIKQWKLWKEKDELDMIFKFLKYLEKAPPSETIVGFNIKFDIRFIEERLSVYGKYLDLWKRLRHERKWYDLYEFPLFSRDSSIISQWLDKFGIKRKCEDIRGEDIPRLYQEKKYRMIIQHNKDDLEVSEQLYLRLKKEYPQLLRL